MSKPDRGLEGAKRMLLSAAADPAEGEWRTGYVAALCMLLMDAYGIDAKYVPATYVFEPFEPTKSGDDNPT